MDESNYLNVYKGPNSVQKYFDPDSGPPLALVEIPECLNPYRGDGVRIYAKMMTMHPANNVKSMPALNLLENSVDCGKTKTLVEYSSGSTVLSMSLVSRAFYGVDDVRAYLSNKTSLAKIRLMQLFGINITLFGGPSQPEPLDERGGIRAAYRLAQESDSAVINPNQYENDNNWKSHMRWTGPQILKQLPEITLICAGMGTSGTMTGLGTYFKETKPSVFRLGVCTAPGDRVPGPRSHGLLRPVKFPWREAVDAIEEVGSWKSYLQSAHLIRQGIVCGPSSGFNLQGLFQCIEKRKADRTLSDLAGPDGEVHCAFLCCDLPYQYVDEYFEKLGEAFFPAITNKELLGVDSYRYDEAWELDASEALSTFFPVSKAVASDVLLDGRTDRPKSDTTIIDLRQPADFEEFHVPGSTNIPFVEKEQGSPFFDPQVLKALWERLENTFKNPNQPIKSLLEKKRVLLLCYDGDSSRVANSVLRARNFETMSIRGGYDVLRRMRQSATQSLADAAQHQDQLRLQLGRDTDNMNSSQSSSLAVSAQPLSYASS